MSVEQLREAGIDKYGVRDRVAAGRLHRLHRGVYAVGHRSLSWRGRWLAAVLAAGDGAVLSHASATALWGFLRPIPGPVHVTVAASTRRKSRAGIVIHRSRTLASSHITHRHDISVTTAARTIEDVRGDLEPYLFRRALRQAELAGHRVPHLSATRRTARISSCSSSPYASATGCRARWSTTASTVGASTSSSPTGGSRSRPTAGSTTAGRSRWRKIASATSSCAGTGSTPAATPAISWKPRRMPWSPTYESLSAERVRIS